MVPWAAIPRGIGLAVFCALLLSSSALAQFETRGPFFSNTFPTSIAVGDFNHDGILDLAVTAETNSNNVVILLGNGDGTFYTKTAYTAGEGAISVVVADFNHDGNLDLAVANSLSTYLTILLGNGDGTFGQHRIPRFRRTRISSLWATSTAMAYSIWLPFRTAIPASASAFYSAMGMEHSGRQ